MALNAYHPSAFYQFFRTKLIMFANSVNEAYIPNSDILDPDFYISRYLLRDVSEKDAERHYEKFGKFDARSPSPYFDTFQYLELYPDVLTARPFIAPGVHFLNHGMYEGRQSSHLIDRYPFLRDRFSLREICNFDKAQSIKKSRIAIVIHAF